MGRKKVQTTQQPVGLGKENFAKALLTWNEKKTLGRNAMGRRKRILKYGS